MKDNEIAALVNKLRDIAVDFHAAQQLRERIAHEIVPHLKRIAELEKDAAGWRLPVAALQQLSKETGIPPYAIDVILKRADALRRNMPEGSNTNDA
jgi:hypothetical protein